MRKVAEHEHREQRLVHNLLRSRVVCKIVAGGIDDRKVDEAQQEAHIDELEDRHVRLRAQFSVCNPVCSRPWGLRIKCLVRYQLTLRQSCSAPFTSLGLTKAQIPETMTRSGS